MDRVPKLQRVYAHIFYGTDIDRYKANYLKGTEPDYTPYGFHHAEEAGFNIEFSNDASGAIYRLLARLLHKTLSVDVMHAFHNRKKIQAADVIWTMTEREAFAIAILFATGILRKKPMVASAVWLFNIWHTLPWHRKLLYRYLLGYISIVCVHSENYIPIIRNQFKKTQSVLLHFGINTGVYKVTPPSSSPINQPIKIFSAGNDKTRDWDTILKAFGNDDRFEINILCNWITPETESQYSNLKVTRRVVIKEFIEFYRSADFVIVAMKENIFSGITVALEAAALGKPVVSSRTGGVPTYFDETEVLYVPPENPESLRQTVLDNASEKRTQFAINAQRKFLKRDYSTKAMAARYAQLTNEISNRQEARASNASQVRIGT
jgi:glycosyltransferase involved in cell wall biosynthesis